MALLGSSIDPRLFQQDYSGYVRAAETQAQGIANLADRIGGAIKDYKTESKERRKEQSEQNKQVKLAESIGNMIVETMPEYADMINPSLAALGDQNIPLADRVVEALKITEGFKTRLDLEGLKRESEMDALRMQKMRMSMQPTAPVAPIERRF